VTLRGSAASLTTCPPGKRWRRTKRGGALAALCRTWADMPQLGTQVFGREVCALLKGAQRIDLVETGAATPVITDVDRAR
jgi:hypothetical protein